MSFDLPAFTLIHVLLSILGIITGLVMAGGMISGVRLDRWTAFFFVTTILTSITGFGFPAETLLPSHIVGALSLLILPVALAARYWKVLAGGWRTTFVITSIAALYLNVFVLFAQLFNKVPAMFSIAPTPEAPAFGVTQLFVLALFVGMGWAAVKGFRTERG
jgi:hypothetical protein